MLAEKRRFNIRDTKKYYSELNSFALKGLEIVTYKGKDVRENEEVSHINKQYLDYLLDKIMFNPVIKDGEDLGGYTVSLNEIDMYGEGDTLKEAIEDLIDSVIEYISIWVKQIDLFSKVENMEKQIYMLKLIRCDNDKNAIKKMLGF